jgi:hypothetical protein
MCIFRDLPSTTSPLPPSLLRLPIPSGLVVSSGFLWSSVTRVEEGVVRYHVGAHLVGPLHDLGRMYTRKASDDHLPNIIILATEWFIRKRPIAAPDLRDLVPISSAS